MYFSRKFRQLGYSINEMVVTITVIGVITTLIIPNFIPALEFVELLLAEKYLLKSVKQCQLALIRQDQIPQYSYPSKNLGLGIVNSSKFIFSSTGEFGECFSAMSSNKLRVSRVHENINNPDYSLIIDVVDGEKTSEGKLPEWLDWWEGSYLPLISEDDPLILDYEF
tara:strand:+ start:863 stop:1363 length:501 start_codon:yes stop_codon:yes gene_type:complete